VRFIEGLDARAKILRSASKLFSVNTLDGTSIRDIARDAGVSETALYRHFPSKDAMAFFLFSEIITHYTQLIRPIKDTPLCAVDRLIAIVSITYDLYERYPEAIRFALLSQYNYWDRLDPEKKPHYVFKEIIEDGLAQGEFPSREVYFYITLFTGIMLQPLAQFSYFSDVLPETPVLRNCVSQMIKLTLTQGGLQ